MIKVIVAGGLGRMASEVCRLINDSEDMELAGIVESPGHPDTGKDLLGVKVTSDIGSLLSKADVVVDFTSPDGLATLLKALKGTTLPLVSGTTGLGESDMATLRESANERAILWSPNMSLGVNLLFKLAADAARFLGDYDVEILEMHHRHKKDAPSGTAKKLAEIIKRERGITKTVYGREGMTGERDPGELGVLALRGGDVAGEHTVYFAQEGERIELTHRASSRLAFARGTLEAVRFIIGRPAGLYEFSALFEPSDILEEN